VESDLQVENLGELKAVMKHLARDNEDIALKRQKEWHKVYLKHHSLA